MIAPSQKANSLINFNELYIALQEQNRTVFMYKADDEVFFYKPLGRKDYRELCQDDTLSEFDKEEIVCDLCVLWPENYNFEDCKNAGLPTVLSREIIHNSFLDDIDNRYALITMYRTEMYERDNQITCIIHEAFPEFDIEEIENWDMEKTAYYLARAEWTLSYLRGVEMDMVYTDNPNEPIQEEEPLKDLPDVDRESTETPSQTGSSNSFIAGETLEERQARLEREGHKKEKLTPEKLAQLRAQFPEINWANSETSIEEHASVDTTPVALRPGWY